MCIEAVEIKILSSKMGVQHLQKVSKMVFYCVHCYEFSFDTRRLYSLCIECMKMYLGKKVISKCNLGSKKWCALIGIKLPIMKSNILSTSVETPILYVMQMS